MRNFIFLVFPIHKSIIGISECLDTSSLILKEVQATLFDIFLRGVAKLKKLQDEVSCYLVIHLEASIISMGGPFLSILLSSLSCHLLKL